MAFTQTPPKPRVRMRSGTANERVKESASVVRQRIHVPPPATAADRKEKEAQQTARVEALMVRGVYDVGQLATLLDMTEREINRQIQVVYARWAVLGGDRDMSRLRGKSLTRYETLVREAWALLANDNAAMKTQDRVNLIKTIADLEAKRADLSGLTPRVIERLALMPNTGNGGIVGRLQEQNKLAEMAGRFADIVRLRREAVGQPTILDNDTGEDVTDFEDDAETR